MCLLSFLGITVPVLKMLGISGMQMPMNRQGNVAPFFFDSTLRLFWEKMHNKKGRGCPNLAVKQKTDGLLLKKLRKKCGGLFNRALFLGGKTSLRPHPEV